MTNSAENDWQQSPNPFGLPDSESFTDERMIPELSHLDVVWDHVYRYKFAVAYARGCDVLDIASGEGYGTAALKAGGAQSVIGVDIDRDACERAIRKYGRFGIEIRTGSANAMPVADESVDLIVSFETIEHVADPPAFLAECRRVLRPDGRLIISTPNTEAYSFNGGNGKNPYHCSEMTRSEFLTVLGTDFQVISEHMQRANWARWWHPRSLAARTGNPLMGRRGFGLLYRRCWSHRPEAAQLVRSDTVAAVLRPDDGYLGRLTNASLVRRPAWFAGEIPIYFLAVAKCR